MPGEDINIPIRALRNDATSNGLCRVYFGSILILVATPSFFSADVFAAMLFQVPRVLVNSFQSRWALTLSLSLGMLMVMVTMAAGYTRYYCALTNIRRVGDSELKPQAINTLTDPQWSLRYTYDIDVCRNRLGLPYHSPSREDLLEFRERPRATFPLSESHNRLYQEFILSSRSSKRQYDQTVKRRHG
jgi:hypothetical protein